MQKYLNCDTPDKDWNIFLFSAPTTVPENVTANATGNSTIYVKWSSIDISAINGFQGFSVKYEADGHPKRSGENKTRHTNEITLTGLRMFTTYKIRVAARTTQNGNYSKAAYTKTLEGGKNRKIYMKHNIPFPSYLVPLFENEFSCNEFYLHEKEPVEETHFHMGGFARRLVLTPRQKTT